MKCVQCEKTESILWHKSEGNPAENAEICNECFTSSTSEPVDVKEEKDLKASNEKEINDTQPAPESKARVRNTRSTRFKSKAVTRQKSTKSISRRSNAFKSNKPIKTPSNICAETKTKTNVFLDGFYYQIGDIVSVVSKGRKYYGQIKALLVDTFMEKSAVLTWLIPTTASPDPNEEFDPSTYLVGYEEDIPRRIKNVMKFEMHAPSNYFYTKTEPFAKPDILEDGLYSEKNKRGFIWQSMH